jgi:hypothetical protein
LIFGANMVTGTSDSPALETDGGQEIEVVSSGDSPFATYVVGGPDIPEPASVVLFGIGAAAVSGCTWLRKRLAA